MSVIYQYLQIPAAKKAVNLDFSTWFPSETGAKQVQLSKSQA